MSNNTSSLLPNNQFRDLQKPQKIVATNETINLITQQEIKKYGLNADLNHIDVSRVTNMSFLFFSSNFNGDISMWDVSNVTNMSFMFSSSKFNGDLSKWDMRNVRNAFCMFKASCFNQDISTWHFKHYNSIKLDFHFNLSHFQHFSSLIPLLEQLKTTEKFKNNQFVDVVLFEITNFDKLSNYSSLFFDFIDFINNQSLDIHCIDYFHSQYPFFCCNLFIREQTLYQNNKNTACQDNKIYQDFCANSSLIHNYIDTVLKTKIPFFNIDFIFFILNDKSYYFNLLDIVDIEFFCQDYKLSLRKTEELVKVLSLKSDKKEIIDYPCLKFIIDEFFEMEKRFIQENNLEYHDFLSKKQQSFSDFYPHYSAQQKQELLKLTEVCITDFNKDYAIDI